MIASKRISTIVIIAVAVAILFCIAAIVYAPKLIEKYGTGVHMEYETRIFDHSEPVVIDIQMDPDEWQTMLDKATQEVYYVCDVVIGGTRFYDVGIRPKGNTSLSSIASNPNTERFSFKLEFDQFVDGQTAWGLDKLCLNNNYADATNIKEALFYDMYEFLGADASLYNFAEIYVNGEYWGIYLALEAVEDSFMLRNYGAQNGELYKPDQMGMSMGGDWGRGNDGDNGWGWLLDLFDGSDDDASGEMRWGGDDDGDGWDWNRDDDDGDGWGRNRDPSDEPAEETDASDEPAEAASQEPAADTSEAAASDEAAEEASGDASDESDDDTSGEASDESGWSWGDDWEWDRDDDDDGDRGGFGGMFGGGGANLSYTGDDLSNYSTIWGCEVTRTDETDHRRVVQALKNISEGVDLEGSMDIDNLLRMMAVHNFSVNSDSLSGSMAHNYYLYESGGQLNILPWDYNLAFGGMGFGGSSADDVANKPIDDSWGSTSFFDPLLENEEYLAKYHEYYRQLIEEYVFGGGFYEFYTRTREQIDDLVAADPNALYDYDEYDAAAETLYALVVYRGESVLGQLNGTIPSTSAGQKQDSSSLIKAEGVDISVMGSMSMGGSFGGGGGWGSGFNPFRRSESSDESSSEEASGETEDDGSGEASDAGGETSETGGGEASADAAAAEDTGSGETGDASSGETTGTASDEAVDTGSAETSRNASAAAADTASAETTDTASVETADTAVAATTETDSAETAGDASGEAEDTVSGDAAGAASDEADDTSGEADDSPSDEAADAASGATTDDASDEADDSASDEMSSESRRSRSESSESSRGWGSGEMNRQSDRSMIWLLAACGIVLIAGIVFAAAFRKKG